MLSFEVLVLGYCSALIALAAASGRPIRRAIVLAAVVALVLLAAGRRPGAIRVWLPHGYLIAGYWIPALMVPADRGARFATPFETWLTRADAALEPALSALRGVRVVALAELAYLFCYPLVPLSFVVVWWEGSAADIERFWLTVLSAGFASYASLPWLLSRPPRIAVPAPAAGGIGALNVLVLDRVSHRWNTFPSGHVAVAFASAWSVAHVSPAPAAVIGLVAFAVAVGAITGRYHYAVDVAAGFLVAVLAGMIIW